MSSHQIRVQIGANFKREAVLINPGISAAEPTISGTDMSGINDNPNKNVIATGSSSREVLRKVYGR